jgi:hypothetical protein
MIAGQVMTCLTGDARQYICGECGAKHWQQTSLAPARGFKHWQQTSLAPARGFNDRPLREINQRLATACV